MVHELGLFPRLGRLVDRLGEEHRLVSGWSGVYRVVVLARAPAWSQYVIANFGAENFSSPSSGKVLVVNAGTAGGQRVLYRTVSGLDPGRSYRASFVARRIVAPGAIRVQVGSAAPVDQAIAALSVTSWTRLSVPFTASSSSTSVAFLLAETSGASFGADFALADFLLEDAAGQSLGPDCLPVGRPGLQARIVRQANTGTSRTYQGASQGKWSSPTLDVLYGNFPAKCQPLGATGSNTRTAFVVSVDTSGSLEEAEAAPTPPTVTDVRHQWISRIRINSLNRNELSVSTAIPGSCPRPSFPARSIRSASNRRRQNSVSHGWTCRASGIPTSKPRCVPRSRSSDP